MTLSEQLFPDGEAHRHDGLLQMQWSDGWADEFLGVGALTYWMTPKLRELHAEMDYAGAAIVFLQRHRVELGLKTLLHHAGAKVKGHRNLTALWSECKAALRSTSRDLWDEFDRTQHEFVNLMAQIDPGSQTFRYPVDKSGGPYNRPMFVDAVALESAGAAFEESVEAWLHHLEVIEQPEDGVD